MKEIFDLYATEENGRLNIKQFGIIWRSLRQYSTEAEYEDSMEDFQTEADDNNNIDYFAFVRIISKFRNSTNSDDELINELRKYDRDKSGLVSLGRF